jgi:uncharacterized membrane protein
MINHRLLEHSSYYPSICFLLQVNYEMICKIMFSFFLIESSYYMIAFLGQGGIGTWIAEVKLLAFERPP